MDARLRRFVLIATLTLVPLHVFTLLVDARWGLSYRQSFMYFMGAGMAAKAVGDLWYHLLSPQRRRWMYLEQWLMHDFLVHTRFVLPLACAQAYVANTAIWWIPWLWPLLRTVWVSPVAGVVVWGINRWQVELAEERRHRPYGTRAANLTTAGVASGRAPAGAASPSPRLLAADPSEEA